MSAPAIPAASPAGTAANSTPTIRRIDARIVPADAKLPGASAPALTRPALKPAAAGTTVPSGTSGTGPTFVASPDGGERRLDDPLQGRDNSVTGARRQAGIPRRMLKARLPDDWTLLDFPFEDPGEVQAYANAAFRHRGWPAVQGFQTQFRSSLSGLAGSLRGRADGPAADFRLAIDHLERAMTALRPRVAEGLLVLEDAAVALLGQRVDTAMAQAREQALGVLSLPAHANGAEHVDSLLRLYGSDGGPLDWRRAKLSLADNASGRRLRDLLKRFAPQAKTFSQAEQARHIAQAFDALKTAAKVGAVTVAAVPPGRVDDAVALQARALEAARQAGALPNALADAITTHRAALASWAECRQSFVAARRAAAVEFPVLHRFGFADVIDGAEEDDAALGARIARKLAGIFRGAEGTRRAYVQGEVYSRIQSKRPARELRKALDGREPPRDPVHFVVERAEGSVWAHPRLIQEATETVARGAPFGGPMSLLDDFLPAVSEQAVAAYAQAQQDAIVKGALEAVGVTAAMIALHAVAPPAAFMLDATLAAGDLGSGLAAFGGESQLARCCFDPAQALGEEPSLAWFLATQAFNLFTVG
ncbi:hypothetical protein [Roseateles sp.]|uniref:hypothetical protein n=1 Tax=Roseateles sp. TaxID=1971397 RepID=UPI0031CDF86C